MHLHINRVFESIAGIFAQSEKTWQMEMLRKWNSHETIVEKWRSLIGSARVAIRRIRALANSQQLYNSESRRVDRQVWHNVIVSELRILNHRDLKLPRAESRATSEVINTVNQRYREIKTNYSVNERLECVGKKTSGW